MVSVWRLSDFVDLSKRHPKVHGSHSTSRIYWLWKQVRNVADLGCRMKIRILGLNPRTRPPKELPRCWKKRPTFLQLWVVIGKLAGKRSPHQSNQRSDWSLFKYNLLTSSMINNFKDYVFMIRDSSLRVWFCSRKVWCTLMASLINGYHQNYHLFKS